MLKVILAEGITDAKFLAGLISIENLDKARNDAKSLISNYNCWYNKDFLICDGGGKDNICRRAKDIYENLTSKKFDFEFYVLLDGDAIEIKCNVGKMYYLSYKNLDELIFEVAIRVLSNYPNALRLLESEKSNSDSKAKLYLTIYLFKKYVSQNKYWSDLSSFSYFISKNYKDIIFQIDKILFNLIIS
jgi:hypothetical protein